MSDNLTVILQANHTAALPHITIKIIITTIKMPCLWTTIQTRIEVRENRNTKSFQMLSTGLSASLLRKCSKQVSTSVFTNNTKSVLFKNSDKAGLLLDSVVSVQQPFQNNDKSWQQYPANLLFHPALGVYFQQLRRCSHGVPPANTIQRFI